VKLALCLGRGAADGAAVVRRMLAAQRLRDHQEPKVVVMDSGVIGWLAIVPPITRVRLVHEEPSGNLLIVTGVPVSMGEPLEHVLASVAAGDHRRAATVLPTLDGAFAAVHWDARARKLVVVTDFLGMQPLFHVESDGALILATELRGAAAAHEGRLAMDPLGWSMFAALGHFAEDATSLAGVRRLPEAAVIVYDTETSRREQSRYWRWPGARPGLTVDTVDTGGLVEAFQRHERAYAVHGADATVLLSGGFDSRLIAATLAGEGLRPPGIVLSHADEHDDADGYLAMRVARSLGLPYTVVPPLPDFYSSAAYVDYLIMNEVATTSFGLFIAQVASSIKGRTEAVWEGVASNYTLRTPHQEGGGFEPFFRTQTAALAPDLWRALRAVFARGIVDDMDAGLRACMRRTREAYPDDAFGVAEFVARSRMRRRTGPNPLKVYANDLLPLTPGLSKEFWEMTAGLPFEVKAEGRLTLELFRRHFPQLARIPFCSDGRLYPGSPGVDPRFALLQLRARLMDHYYVAAVARRLGLRPATAGGPALLLERVLARVDPSHPDLSADTVRPLIAAGASADPVTRAARRWLFYWQMWRWVMEGDIHRRRAELVGEGAE
jgi:hypothetical protein